MFDYEGFEATSGHDLTLLSQQAGVSTYYCENCGALVEIQQGETLRLFHSAKGSTSTQDFCPPVGPDMADYWARLGQKPMTLRQKLKRLQEEDWERLREGM